MTPACPGERRWDADGLSLLSNGFDARVSEVEVTFHRGQLP